MKKALYQTVGTEPDTVHCSLCPHNCRLKPGQTGICRVRKNINGTLFSENYGRICSTHYDPIEKKPLYHYFPGSTIFSIGSVGCNLHCDFCQNHEISQCGVTDQPYLRILSPAEIMGIALSRSNNTGIAYTYNEPLVWFEFMKDVALAAREKGLKNVMVTNGFINPEPLRETFTFMDAFSVDLKGFDPGFFVRHTSSRLEPVLESLRMIRASGKHLEVTNLVIPGLNDDPVVFEKMAAWISGELGRTTVLHISRYFPQYKLKQPATPVKVLHNLHEIASRYLDFVYTGNIHDDNMQNTHCPECGRLLVERYGYLIKTPGLNTDHCCNHCGWKLQ